MGICLVRKACRFPSTVDDDGTVAFAWARQERNESEISFFFRSMLPVFDSGNYEGIFSTGLLCELGL